QQPYTAAGDTLHLATRLQRQAAPDTILVSTATYALVQDEVRGVACETLSQDALSAPMPVYALRNLKRRRAGVPRRGVRPMSCFVGRTQELALLHERLAHAVGGQGQVIGIAGEPGLGKSRLLAEFACSLDGQPVTYCAGHCLAYGSTTPYLPVLALLRQRCGIIDGDAPDVITARVQQALKEGDLVPDEAGPVLLRLLDIPVEMASLAALSPAALKARTFAVLRHLSLHGKQPGVLAVENLHWITPPRKNGSPPWSS